MIELAGTEGLHDFSDGEADGGRTVEQRNLETIRDVVTKSASAAQAASAVLEVVMAVFAVVKSGRAAVGSVFFDVTTSFVLHEARFPF